MRADLTDKNALVLGGTGAIGAAVLRELAVRGVKTTFTYCQNAEAARVYSEELGHRAVRVDFAEPGAIEKLFAELESVPNVLIHCAGISAPLALAEINDDVLRRTLAINAIAPLGAAKLIDAQGEPADIVFVGALERGQSLPLPVHFAASQGMLSAMTMALGHELGPRGTRVNMITLGVMNEGMSEALESASRRDYERFSSLRRVGTPAEAAKAIVWLALENTYIQGRVIPVNGGI